MGGGEGAESEWEDEPPWILEEGGVKVAEKRCRYCKSLFVPDPRVGDRQKACSLACQRLRKKEHNRIYRLRHPECWENHYRDYVKPWRGRRPDYQRQWRERRRAVEKGWGGVEIQAERLSKAMELTEKTWFYLREIKAEILLKSSSEASWVFLSS